MTRDSSRSSLFDSHVDSYDDDCMRGLKLSGESREYFARGRLGFLREWWERTGRAHPGRIIDYGCGTGGVTALLAEQFPGARVTGLDPSRESISRATGLYAGERVAFVALGDDTTVSRAQLIHVNGVVHHVAPADRRSLFADIRERLVESGVFALFENNPINPGTRLVMSRIPFDRDAVPIFPREARNRLCDAGFTVAHQGYLFYFPHPLRALRPLEPWLKRVPLGAQYGIIATRD